MEVDQKAFIAHFGILPVKKERKERRDGGTRPGERAERRTEDVI